MTILIARAYKIIWGIPMLVLILGVGLYLSIQTRFVQIYLFPQSVCSFFASLSGRSGGRMSSFRALCTALAATVGTGNLIGVAGAICIGGPGAVFWMWVCAFLGMAVKYAEAVLSVRFRGGRPESPRSGPMYVLQNGMHCRLLAAVYAIFGVLACFGVGNAVQVHAILSGLQKILPDVSPTAAGLCLSILVGLSLLGNAKRIGGIAELLVPFGVATYLFLCGFLLVLRREQILPALSSIFLGAFSPQAVTGGMLGSAYVTMRTGCSRGVFTNEAGMGTAAIAHGCAEVSHPAEQGLMAITEVFLDTIVICTLTALVILCSGAAIPYGVDKGAELTDAAFLAVLGPWSSYVVAGFLCYFAFATILGWSVYGLTCFQFLFGEASGAVFCVLQTVVVLLAARWNGQTIWQLAELLNGLMSVPNLIALTVLSPELIRLTKEYISGVSDANGGTYANIHQCEPL